MPSGKAHPAAYAETGKQTPFTLTLEGAVCLRKLHVRTEAGRPVPLAWLDSFAMRNFTGDAAFDDTLPIADGLLEAGLRVPVPALILAMEAWFRRKGWLHAQACLLVSELHPSEGSPER